MIHGSWCTWSNTQLCERNCVSESRMLPGPSILQKSTSSFHAFAFPTPHKKLHHLVFLLPQQKTPSILFKCCAPSSRNSTKRGRYIFLPPDGFVLHKKFSQSLSSHGSQIISLKQKPQVTPSPDPQSAPVHLDHNHHQMHPSYDANFSWTKMVQSTFVSHISQPSTK